MSQNIQLGISLICGGATYGLASVANLSSGVGIALAVAVGGIVLIALGSKNSASIEETVATVKSKAKKEAKKLPSPQKVAQKAQKVVQKAAQKVQKAVKEEPKEEDDEEPEVPETPDKKKSKKKKKSSGGTPLSSPSPQHKPGSQHTAPKQKAAPKVEEDKDLSKNQLRKLKKKEAEEKQKIEDEKQRSAELARKALEQKREAAQQKKLQAKARKAAQKATQTPETKVETKQPVSHQPEDGWEVAPARTRGKKDVKDSKEPIVIDVKIAPRQHAMIIGRQGEGLKKLEQDLDVIITMPKRDSGNDLILIKGLPKDVYTAKKAMEEIATKGYSSVTQPGWVTKPAELKTKGQLALVFGEKGSTLQAISRATGTRLQMPEKGTKDLQVSVTGDERAVDQALSLIQELIDQGYTKTTHPEWVQDEVQVVDPAILGAIIGPKGATIQRISKDNKVKIDTPKLGESSSKADIVFIRGAKKNVAKAKQAILEIIASREPAIEQEIPDPAWQGDVEEVAW